MVEAIPQPIKDTWDRWNIRGMVILSLTLQTILIFFAPLRKRTSRKLLVMLVWSSYLLADWAANFAVGLISKNQGKDPKPSDLPKDKKLMALWAPFLLLHLGGPDTITALALEDNALWLRHLFGLVFQAVAGAYAVVQSLPNVLWPPIVMLFVTGTVKYIERTRALYRASLDKFRDAMLKAPDPGPNYAKLMEEYAAKKDSKLPTKITLIEEPDKHQKPSKLGRPDGRLTDLHIVQYAYKFFDTFKGLVVSLIFSFRERDESRDFFLDLEPEEALRIIEVELGFIYEALFTKVVVLHTWTGTVSRVIAFGSFVSALCVFYYRPKKHNEFHGADIVITYILFLVGIALDLASIFMFVLSDWTFAILSKLKDDPKEEKSRIDPILEQVLSFRKPQWKKHKCFEMEHEVLTTPLLLRRWSGSIHVFNFVGYCMNKRVERIHNVKGKFKHLVWENILSAFSHIIGNVQMFFRSIGRWINKVLKSTIRVINDWSRENQGAHYVLYPIKISIEFLLRIPQFFRWLVNYIIDFFNIKDLLDEIWFVSSEPLTKDLWNFIFEELKRKSVFGESPENARIISLARGEWTLRDTQSENANHDKLLHYVAQVDYDQSLLLWHIATELCYQEEGPTKENYNDREFSKILSDYMMYLLIMKPKLMSEVAGIGKIRFRDTLAEADKFFKRRHIKSPRNCEKEATKTILSVSTDIEPMDVKGDRSKSVLFDASVLAKELQRLEGSKWSVLSRVWVELLSYAANHCEVTAHVAQLSKGGELISFVWLLMAHFGLGDQFQINKGDARAKLMIGK